SNNKFHFKNSDGKITYVQIPEGSYEIEDIENYILREMIQLTTKENMGRKRKLTLLMIRGNNNTMRTEIKCSVDIDFSKNNSIGHLLGFKPRLLKANTTHESDFPAKILKVNTLCVGCNIVGDSYRNGKQVHVIHEFFPTVPPGFRIVETPSNVIYLPINTQEIDELVLKLTDQAGNLVNFRGEVITIRLHLQKL